MSEHERGVYREESEEQAEEDVPQGVEDHDNGAGIRLLADLGDHSQRTDMNQAILLASLAHTFNSTLIQRLSNLETDSRRSNSATLLLERRSSETQRQVDASAETLKKVVATLAGLRELPAHVNLLKTGYKEKVNRTEVGQLVAEILAQRDFATKADVDALKSSFNSLKTAFDTFSSDISSLKASLEKLETSGEEDKRTLRSLGNQISGLSSKHETKMLEVDGELQRLNNWLGGIEKASSFARLASSGQASSSGVAPAPAGLELPTPVTTPLKARIIDQTKGPLAPPASSSSAPFKVSSPSHLPTTPSKFSLPSRPGGPIVLPPPFSEPLPTLKRPPPPIMSPRREKSISSEYDEDEGTPAARKDREESAGTEENHGGHPNSVEPDAENEEPPALGSTSERIPEIGGPARSVTPRPQADGCLGKRTSRAEKPLYNVGYYPTLDEYLRDELSIKKPRRQ